MIFSSDALRRWVAPHCNVAYDVMVFVGQALFQRHRSTEEVRTELLSRNVALSASEVGYLGRKFISYLALAHRQATPRMIFLYYFALSYFLISVNRLYCLVYNPYRVDML